MEDYRMIITAKEIEWLESIFSLKTFPWWSTQNRPMLRFYHCGDVETTDGVLRQQLQIRFTVDS